MFMYLVNTSKVKVSEEDKHPKDREDLYLQKKYRFGSKISISNSNLMKYSRIALLKRVIARYHLWRPINLKGRS